MVSSDHLSFMFTRAEETPLLPANGAWGGITPDGMVSAWFFMDFPGLPLELRAPVAESDGALVQLASAPESDEPPHIERRVMCALVMSPEKAREIGAWLIQQAEESDARREQRK